MRLVSRSVTGSALALLLLSQLAHADTIRLKNGNTIDGQILTEDDTKVMIKIGGGQAMFLKAEIASIIRSPVQEAAGQPSPAAKPTIVKRFSHVGKFLRPFLTAEAEYAQHNNKALELFRQSDQQGALKELEQAARLFWSLQESLVSVLKGLAAHSLVRVPTLWLMLTLLNGRPSLRWVILYEWFIYALKVATIKVTLSVLAAPGIVSTILLAMAMPAVVLLMVFALMGKFNIGFWRGSLVLMLAGFLNLGAVQLLLRSYAF